MFKYEIKNNYSEDDLIFLKEKYKIKGNITITKDYICFERQDDFYNFIDQVKHKQ